ncbi:MAG: response regulator [Butyricimonas paravirosa]
MYAEDEAETREVYRDNLVAMGYDVCAVEDGDQAVEMYKHEDFDLLLLDVVLPGKQGDEILKWLRSRGDRTPVVIFSSTNTYLVDR